MAEWISSDNYVGWSDNPSAPQAIYAGNQPTTQPTLTQQQYLDRFSKGLMPSGSPLQDVNNPEYNSNTGFDYQKIFGDYYGSQPEGTNAFDYNGTQMQAVRPGEALFDQSNIVWDAARGQYLTKPDNVVPDPGITTSDWITALTLALGPMAAGSAVGAGTASGAAASTGGSFIPSTATSGMMGLGSSGSTALGLGYGGVGTMGAGLTSAELAGLYAGGVGTTAMGGMLGTGGGIMTAAGGEAYSAAMAQGLGQDAAMQAAMQAGGGVGTGTPFGLSDAYDLYKQGKQVNSAYNALTGSGQTAKTGSTGMATDWGSMLGSLGSTGAAAYLGNQNIDYAQQMADKIKFTPYSISSNMGQTYQDPSTGQMMSQMSPETQGMYDAFGNAVQGNLQYATMDPMEASQYAYNMGSQLNAYQDEQNRLGLENRLLSQGMLGSTGGGTQMRSLYDSMNQRDLGREAQSLQLGQGMLDSYQNRANSAYQPMASMNQGMSNQLGQSASMGGQAMSGQTAGANLMNNAFMNNQDALASGASNLFGSSGVSGSNGLINQGVNWLGGQTASGVGNWLGGNTGTGYNLDQYNNLMSQQDGFNWSGVSDVSAGSAQDMMLNDQWDWSW